MKAVNTIPASFQRLICDLDLEKKTHVAMMAEAGKMGIKPKKIAKSPGIIGRPIAKKLTIK